MAYTTIPATQSADGTIVYAAANAQAVLRPTSTYFLLSQESAGGDHWYDTAGVTGVAPAVTINESDYTQDPSTYVSTANPGVFSYGPVSLKFTTSGTPTVAISQPASGATLSGTVTLTASATSSAGMSSVQFRADGNNIGPLVSGTGPSYSANWDTTSLANGNHVLTASATAADGSTATAAAVNVTVSNVAASGSPLLTGVDPNSHAPTRSNFAGYVGLKFTVGSTPLTVTQLGRMVISPMSTAHQVVLLDADNLQSVATASIAANSGSNGAIAYGAATPNAVLAARHAYFLLSQEFMNGDSWTDTGGLAGVTTAATINESDYTANPSSYVSTGTAGVYSFGPVSLLFTTGSTPTVSISQPAGNSTVSGTVTLTANAASSVGVSSVQFKVGTSNIGTPVYGGGPAYSTQWNTSGLANGNYMLSAVATAANGTTATATANVTVNNTASSDTALLTGVDPNYHPSSRNNYDGYVGLKFTVGSTPVTVTQLGRTSVSQITRTHFLKVVDASNIQNVVATATIQIASGNPDGTIVYAPVDAQVTLQANHTYYLMSQEASGGDLWYDTAGVTGIASAVTVVESDYSQSLSSFGTAASGAFSYGPVSLKFH